jgi:S-DNA-T family DNA segregation ATPase FtsK/SpoIIIE
MVDHRRPAFTLVRTPYVPDAVADRIARRGAHLVRDPIELQTQMLRHPGPATRPNLGGRAAAHSAKNIPPLSVPPTPT